MSPLEELVRDWSPPIWLSGACLLSLLVYLRGFLLLRRSRSALSVWRPISFGSGLLVLWLALASPLEDLADTVLTAHMVEHLLLMSAVPPLLLLGLPTVPLLRGLPAWFRRPVIHPLLRSRPLRGALHWLTRPAVAWLLMNSTLLLWHIPGAYDFALDHEVWHDVEHLCFLASSLLFWWVLLRPWPARPESMGWGVLLYLISADFVNTALSATLAFVGHPVYGYYLVHGNSLGLDPITDQTVGACIMWVFGSIAFLLPALILAGKLLHGREPTLAPQVP